MALPVMEGHGIERFRYTCRVKGAKDMEYLYIVVVLFLLAQIRQSTVLLKLIEKLDVSQD